MTVRAGREFLAIPGPTNMPDEVLQAMHRPALDIYSREMIDLSDGLHDDLSKLFATKSRAYIHIANGHGAWEAALSNVLSRGDKVLVLESGRFAIGWGNAAELMGVEVEVLKGDWRRAVRPAEVEARLRQDKEHKIKAILVAQVDTASGVWNDIEAEIARFSPIDAPRKLPITAAEIDDRFDLIVAQKRLQQPNIGPVDAWKGAGTRAAVPEVVAIDVLEDVHSISSRGAGVADLIEPIDAAVTGVGTGGEQATARRRRLLRLEVACQAGQLAAEREIAVVGVEHRGRVTPRPDFGVEGADEFGAHVGEVTHRRAMRDGRLAASGENTRELGNEDIAGDAAYRLA